MLVRMWKKKRKPWALSVGMQHGAATIKKMKTRTQKDIHTSMFTVALFTITKTWKQPKYSLMDEWIKKICCT